jgi:hypothetical protein
MARNTKTQSAKAVEEQFVHVEDTTGTDDIGTWEAMRNLAASMGYEVPTGKRAIWGAVTGVAVTVLGVYSGMQLAGYLAVGAILLTGSMFLAYVLLILGSIAAIVSAMVAASRAAQYVATGQLEKDVVRAKNWVAGFFNKASATKPVAA